MMWNQGPRERFVANGDLLPNPQKKASKCGNGDCNDHDMAFVFLYIDFINTSSMTTIGAVINKPCRID
jgi:hypothetical protein